MPEKRLGAEALTFGGVDAELGAGRNTQLNADQQAAIQHALTNMNRVMVMCGAALPHKHSTTKPIDRVESIQFRWG